MRNGAASCAAITIPPHVAARSVQAPARLVPTKPPRHRPWPCAGLMAFAVDLEVLAAMVSVGTLATFFMISFGTLWRRYHSAKQPLRPLLAAQLAGIVLGSLGELVDGGSQPS